MTRSEAKMIAEEVYKLLVKEGLNPSMMSPERYMGVKEAAEYLCMPVKTLYNKVTEIPHVKKGKRLIFSESSLRAYISGTR